MCAAFRPFLLLLLFGSVALAADPLPPKPARYVEDQAGLLSPSTRDALVQKLAAFERDTSDQVLVAILPSVPGDYAMEDFTQRTAEAWGVGQKAHDNGAVLFIFPKDHKMRIEVGYGLEGAIPDATAKSILDRIVTPAFRAGDFNGGVTRGVDAILQAAKGEYQGAGQTVAEREDDGESSPDALFLIILAVFLLFLIVRGARSRGWDYSTRKNRAGSWWNSGGWGGGSGGFSSGGGGGFSGGGGSFGGGGASGGW